MVFEQIFSGLNDEQRHAVETVRGPLCILAGAGSGKTTTITRRIAHQVATETFFENQILAVTFTDKAAKEMGSRLRILGAPRVRARTFHAEARAQYLKFVDKPGEILSSKAPVLASLIQRLPMPHKFTSVRDIATEIEWAKSRRISPQQYEERLGDHQAPIPGDLMASVYAGYESRKKRAGMMDFEDLLEHTIRFLEDNRGALREIRSKYGAFTVDEYQDANLLQQTLLDLWLGEREEICVVGDDYQSIYGFTGASPQHLVNFPACYQNCCVVQLTMNYRSTPEILATANKLVPGLGGTPKALRPALAPGNAPVLKRFEDAPSEIDWIVQQIQGLVAKGLSLDQIAVLYRINARSEAFEEALSKAGVAYQVADSPFLRRPAARTIFQKLKSARGPDVAAAVAKAAELAGYNPYTQDRLTGDEATRQSDLGRIVLMARQYEGGGGIVGFLADLASRFTDEQSVKGVQLLTYHRSKGKEYEAVFLPRLEEREMPFVFGEAPSQVAEERRLFYVGITRAKRWLHMSWAAHRDERWPNRRPSRFLAELGFTLPPSPNGSPASKAKTKSPLEERAPIDPATAELVSVLKKWRTETAKEKSLPAYVIFHDSVLIDLAQTKPATESELLSVKGIGPSKYELYGETVLEILAKARSQEAQA